MRPPVPRSTFDADFELDEAQKNVVDLLTSPTIEGLYMWGPVGRGKTWILDRYFAAAPGPKKRVHFHTFFRDLHASYFVHRFQLDRTLDALLGETQLLCFDEFHVHDIGDARLLGRMIDALLSRGIALVATSNYPPDDLLPNPLFHDAFVPTIAVLKANLHVVAVDGPVDYRGTNRSYIRRFASGTWSTGQPANPGRTFAELCESPRSTGDYLALIETLTDDEEMTIAEIPALANTSPDAGQRFSNLVDVLYDADVATRFHSSVTLEDFSAGMASLDVERTLSRLRELGRLREMDGPNELGRPSELGSGRAESQGDAHS